MPAMWYYSLFYYCKFRTQTTSDCKIKVWLQDKNERSQDDYHYTARNKKRNSLLILKYWIVWPLLSSKSIQTEQCEMGTTLHIACVLIGRREETLVCLTVESQNVNNCCITHNAASQTFKSSTKCKVASKSPECIKQCRSIWHGSKTTPLQVYWIHTYLC